MKLIMMDDDEFYDKRIVLSLGMQDGNNFDFVSFTVYNDSHFEMCEGYSGQKENPSWFYEEISIDTARKLRDFLNYAIKD